MFDLWDVWNYYIWLLVFCLADKATYLRYAMNVITSKSELLSGESERSAYSTQEINYKKEIFSLLRNSEDENENGMEKRTVRLERTSDSYNNSRIWLYTNDGYSNKYSYSYMKDRRTRIEDSRI